MLGLFAANFSLGFFLSLCSRVVYTSRSFLGQWQGLFAAKLGEELDVSVLWVELGLEFCQVKELETCTEMT